MKLRMEGAEEEKKCGIKQQQQQHNVKAKATA